ncbi:hypothetical protein DOY81_010190 [Sarcophaga bullata]|nr:hypothetical protein DOY81_010190 [Sarcophaga bullata]
MVVKKPRPKKKPVTKKVAPAPLAVKKPVVKKVVNQLFEKRPKNFGIGNQKAVLQKRLKVPPPIHQFSQTLDKTTAVKMFKLLEKYRPESAIAKKQRLKKIAEAKAKGKDIQPKKKPTFIRAGTNTVTKLVEQKKAQLVVIAHDVDPLEVSSNSKVNRIVLFLPALCRKMGVHTALLRQSSSRFVGPSQDLHALALTHVEPNDKANFSKVIEAIKTNYK